MTDIKLSVFGREMLVSRSQEQWLVYLLGTEGKRRLADDIAIPPDIQDRDIAGYLADFYHEWATPKHNDVVPLD